jgi:hypothetical protein
MKIEKLDGVASSCLMRAGEKREKPLQCARNSAGLSVVVAALGGDIHAEFFGLAQERDATTKVELVYDEEQADGGGGDERRSDESGVPRFCATRAGRFQIFEEAFRFMQVDLPVNDFLTGLECQRAMIGIAFRVGTKAEAHPAQGHGQIVAFRGLAQHKEFLAGDLGLTLHALHGDEFVERNENLIGRKMSVAQRAGKGLAEVAQVDEAFPPRDVSLALHTVPRVTS